MTAFIDIDIKKRLGAFELAAKLSLPAHGVLGVFGRSGAGKTTFINALAGTLTPDTGHIRVGGATFFDAATRTNLAIESRGVGYVFQDGRLFPHLDVKQNLRYGQMRASRRQRAQSIGFDTVVDVLGLGALLARRSSNLSGGEKQRVALGRALLTQPRLLLMDEPLASLDAPRKSEVIPYIERLRHDFSIPIVYVTHSVDEVTRLADHLMILVEGKTVVTGDLVSVMSDPLHAPLFGRHEAGTVLDCKLESHDTHFQISTLSFLDGYLRVPAVDLAPGTPVRVRLRSREVALSTRRLDDVSITNQLAGHVAELIERQGPYIDVVVALGHTSIRALITRESCERLGLVPGTPVWALIKAVALDRRSVAA